MSNRTLTVSTVVVVALFVITAAIHFGLMAVAGPFEYGLRQGMGGFRGPMGPGAFGGHIGLMTMGNGWLSALTSFGLIVLPVILVGLLIVAIANRPRPGSQPEPDELPQAEAQPAPARKPRSRSK